MSSTREDDTDNNIYYRVHVILFLGANRNPGENFKTSNCFHFNSKTLAIIRVHFLKQTGTCKGECSISKGGIFQLNSATVRND